MFCCLQGLVKRRGNASHSGASLPEGTLDSPPQPQQNDCHAKGRRILGDGVQAFRRSGSRTSAAPRFQTSVTTDTVLSSSDVWSSLWQTQPASWGGGGFCIKEVSSLKELAKQVAITDFIGAGSSGGKVFKVSSPPPSGDV